MNWIDTLPTGGAVTGAEIFPGMIGRVGYGWTYSQLTVIPQRVVQADITLALTDAGKHFYHPPSDSSARTLTIPDNASVAFGVGQAFTFVNDLGAGDLTIAVVTDTMFLAGAGSLGSRVLAAGGVATAIKLASTRWVISGAGLS